MEQRTASQSLYTLAYEWLEAKERLETVFGRKVTPFNGSLDSYMSARMAAAVFRARSMGTQDALTAAWRLLAVAEGFYTPEEYTVPDWFEEEYPGGMYTDPETGFKIPMDGMEFDDSMEFYRSSDVETIEALIESLGREERARRRSRVDEVLQAVGIQITPQS
jgi:hypothetical protein